MDPRKNPYAPGAGTPPPELAGRDLLLENASIGLDRVRAGLSAKCLVMVGLRGVGKTVLLNRIAIDADAKGFATVVVEAPEGGSLPALLASPLRAALVKISRKKAAEELAKRALQALAGFASAMKVKYQDVEFGVDLDAEPGVADSGNLEHDLLDLFRVAGEAAQENKTALTLFVDELQYLERSQFGAMIAALHRIAQMQLPVALVGAGLPQIVARAGEAKSYAERLFSFADIGPLEDAPAALALEAPAQSYGVAYERAAIEEIIRRTRGYPYFLQEWGKHCWDSAEASPVTVADVDTATADAILELDATFFRVRLDRLTPAQKRYLRAMAELGPGPHRSGKVAEVLDKRVTSVAPTRALLIEKGMIYSPAHGDTAFTVPLFDEYLRRTMPL